MIPENKTSPLLTIVTVVFNGEAFIENTILSVINQNYRNMEYVVIDGGSTDCTLNIIKKYAHRIDCLVSEKDNGIYDAMNKGVQRASGEWINFLNAGDSISFDPDCLSKYDSNVTLFVYGNAIVKDGRGGTLYISGKEIQQSDLLNSMPVCHQAIFYSRKFILPYDLRYKIIADRVMTYSLMNSEFKSRYDVNIRVEYLEGGMSYQNNSIKFREEIMFLKDLDRDTLRLRFVRYLTVYVKSTLYNIIRSNLYSSALYSAIKKVLLRYWL